MSAPEGRIVLIAGEGALPVEIARRLSKEAARLEKRWTPSMKAMSLT